MKIANVETLLKYGLFFYFTFPFIIFLKYFDVSLQFNINELIWALKNAFLQSGVAAFVCVALGLVMSLGVLQLSRPLQKLILTLLLVPQIVPVLFSVLIAFTVFKPFPIGTLGIIIIFIFINLGFSTVMTYNSLQSKLGNLALISEVYSLGRLTFLKNVLFKVIKSDFITNFFVIFIFCFSSFSVPLIAGGGRGVNIEVLIYEKIFIDQNWSLAFGLCLLQSIFIFSMSYFFLKSKSALQSEFSEGPYLQSKSGVVLVLVYLGLFFGGYLKGVIQSLLFAENFMMYATDLISATVTTTQALLIFLLLNFVMLYLWILDFVYQKKINTAVNLISMSTIMIGFTFYLFLPSTEGADLLKMNLAASILMFPALFKIFLQAPIQNLKSHIETASVFGLSKNTIIIEVILGQIKRPLMVWSSFLIIWFISEYAIFRALGIQKMTLGMMGEGFLSSYRLPLSYMMSLYILVYWVLLTACLFFIFKVIHVGYKKFVS